MPMYEIIALAKRLNYNFEELKEISLTTLLNMLLSSVEKSDDQPATQKEIDSFF